MTLETIRAVAKALDIRVDLTPRWRAGDLDRLLNAAALAAARVGRAGRSATCRTGSPQPEVSFAIYGERGVIDILAWHPRLRVLLVIELKTDIADINELVGTADRKRRLAVQVAIERGWIAARERAAELSRSGSSWPDVARTAAGSRRTRRCFGRRSRRTAERSPAG